MSTSFFSYPARSQFFENCCKSQCGCSDSSPLSCLVYDSFSELPASPSCPIAFTPNGSNGLDRYFYDGGAWVLDNPSGSGGGGSASNLTILREDINAQNNQTEFTPSINGGVVSGSSVLSVLLLRNGRILTEDNDDGYTVFGNTYTLEVPANNTEVITFLLFKQA